MLKDKVLLISELSKSYGRIKAVDHLNLEVNRGEIFGILGPNGSGKTTTLGIILGALASDEGTFSWFGEKPGPASNRRIGSILETPLFYPFLNAIDNLRIISEIKNASRNSIDDILHQVGLYDRRQSQFRTFSLGMKQRLAVAAALVGDPEVLILDEPTNGLDPQGIADVRELILSIAAQGKTILLASHLLDEVQKICKHVAVLNKGKCLFNGNVDEMLVQTRSVVLISENLSDLRDQLSQYEGVTDVILDEICVRAELKPAFSSTDLNRFLFEKGIVLSHLSTEKRSLETYFLDILEKES
jgi:ABC-2 type transport system ATP-binding protein